MQRLTRLLAMIALATVGFAIAQEDAPVGRDIMSITVQEGSIVDFINSDTETTCQARLSELGTDEAEAAVEPAINPGLNDFVCFREALQATGLTDMFNDNADVTLLAPTDQAFADHLENTGISATDLLADTTSLRDILSYHILTEGRALGDLVGATAGEENTFATALGPELQFITGVAGGGAAEQPEDVSIGAGVLGEGATGQADIVGNTIAFAEGYLIPINALLLPPAQ